jgi:2-polyprenyl-3-methyl-5-hydroxy-6-metoxy-1,4-benzoquinol methylase
LSDARQLKALLSPPDMARAGAELGSEPARCVVCAGAAFERLFRRAGKWFWRCLSCRLVFVHDIYPEFAEDTGHLDETYALGELRLASPRQRAKSAAALRQIEPWRRLNRLLEVGCGQGLFLEQAARAGWQVQGVDLLVPVVELARRRGLPVFAGELHAAAFPPGSFDVVTMSEVIEHVIEPVPLMREVARVLRPGGVAVLGTGNAASWAARWRGAAWSYYRFGGHLHIRFYSPTSAAALARAAGFESLECRTRGFALREAEELRGRWYKPLFKLAQAPLSPLATAAGAGHRLVLTFHRGGARG